MQKPAANKKLANGVVLLLGAGLVALYQLWQPKPAPQTITPNTPPTSSAVTAPPANTANQAAIAKIRGSQRNPDAKFWTTVQGKVVKLLKDDREGSPHQRFLVNIAPDITLLVAHNIELAPRIPTQEGDTITISGEYVWNNRGGVLHWTHHNPKGRRGGWVEVNGKRFE